MASFTVIWVLPALAIVGCVLTRTVAGDPEIEFELDHLLDDESLKGKDVSDILEDRENKNEEIEGFTVGQWIEACRGSIEKCSYDGFKEVSDMGDGKMLALSKYALYCVNEKLVEYCKNHLDTVVSRSLKNEQYKHFVRLFLTSLKWQGVQETPKPENIEPAYEAVKRQIHRNGDLTADQEIRFLVFLGNALRHYDHTGFFLIEELELEKEDIPLPEDDKWILDFFALKNIECRFGEFFNRKIRKLDPSKFLRNKL